VIATSSFKFTHPFVAGTDTVIRDAGSNEDKEAGPGPILLTLPVVVSSPVFDHLTPRHLFASVEVIKYVVLATTVTGVANVHVFHPSTAVMELDVPNKVGDGEPPE
jgi:hypothetical protein